MQKIALEILLLNWAKKSPETLARVSDKLQTSWKPKTRQLSLIDYDYQNAKMPTLSLQN
jgi:hypothetical protein